MLNKKILSGVTLSMAVCLSACSAGGTEVTETVSEAATEAVTAAAETTATAGETTTVTTAETTTEVTTEAVDTSGVEYIKEALQAEWEDSEHCIFVVNLYAEDLNGDGVKELFANYTFSAGQMGITYVYDVSDGVEKLYEISARMWDEKSELYKDENGTVHLIRKEGYAGGTYQMDGAYFDITYDSIKMPFYAKMYDWYDGGAHLFDFDIYKNCEVAPLDFQDDGAGWRNFDPEKAEYIGRYDLDDVWKALDGGENNEISNIIQKEVFDGMTYISDVEEIYEGSTFHEDFEDFDSFWQQAAPKLAEVYGK